MWYLVCVFSWDDHTVEIQSKDEIIKWSVGICLRHKALKPLESSVDILQDRNVARYVSFFNVGWH